MAKIFREEKQFPTKITIFADNKQQNNYNTLKTRQNEKNNLNRYGTADSSNDASFFSEESHQG